MSRRRLFFWRVMTATSLLTTMALGPSLALAQQQPPSSATPPPSPAHELRPSDTQTLEAGIHFRRGVQLYGEADYAGALVEFNRAYALVPSSAALYDAGEAQYQLQDYASALKTFLRFLGEYGPSESHRAEVESTVEILRGRVGHLNVVTVPAGAEVSVDDRAAGRTPLGQPLLISVGHRKVTAVLTGHAPATRFVDVAVGDEASVTLELAPIAPQAGAPVSATSDQSLVRAAPRASSVPSSLRTIGWIATGAFVAGAVTMGALALQESNELKTARDSFPASAATLQDESNRTRTYSIVADSLTAAAVVVGAVTLWSTLTPAGPRTTERAARLDLTPSSINFQASF